MVIPGNASGIFCTLYLNKKVFFSLNEVIFEMFRCEFIKPVIMEIFYNAAVIWFIVGFIFFLLEFVVPGLILFFFAVGAWLVAILSLFIDLSINSQLLIFLATSIV